MMEGFLQEVVMELCRLPAEKVKKKKMGSTLGKSGIWVYS